MRALIDYRPALRDRSGIGEFTHELVRALAASVAPGRLDLSVFSSSWRDRLDVGEPGFERVHQIDRRWPVRVLNLAWHRAGAPAVESLTRAHFDVVHSMTPLLVPAREAAQVVTIADLSFLTDPSWTRAEIRRDYPALVHEHARRAHGVLVMTEHVRASVQRALDVDPEKIAVVSPGAPPWTPRASAPADGYILFLGTLEPRKNVGVLLDAYERLVNRGDTPPLVLAGKATDAACAWLDRIARPPLAGKVEHRGYVAASARRSLYEGARVLVLPSLDEGFGLPVLEAMTAGVPVVASTRGSLPEVLGGAGQLVEPDDADGFANAIDRVIRDHVFAAECTARGIARAQQFRWDRAAQQAYALYEHAVERRRCASA